MHGRSRVGTFGALGCSTIAREHSAAYRPIPSAPVSCGPAGALCMRFHRWKHREFITLLGGATAAWALAAGGSSGRRQERRSSSAASLSSRLTSVPRPSSGVLQGKPWHRRWLKTIDHVGCCAIGVREGCGAECWGGAETSTSRCMPRRSGRSTRERRIAASRRNSPTKRICG
jgi:hypothetical protein